MKTVMDKLRSVALTVWTEMEMAMGMVVTTVSALTAMTKTLGYIQVPENSPATTSTKTVTAQICRETSCVRATVMAMAMDPTAVVSVSESTAMRATHAFTKVELTPVTTGLTRIVLAQTASAIACQTPALAARQAP